MIGTSFRSDRPPVGDAPPNNPLTADQRHLQHELLDGVSRTFALNVPELDEPLASVVGNGYLLCRIADTIEDAPNLNPAEKRVWLERYLDVVVDPALAQDFADTLVRRLGAAISDPERRLLSQTAAVLGITACFTAEQRDALTQCVRIMSAGMAEFAENAGADGLATITDFDRYCYVVAGVVGEMLASLFALEVPSLRTAPAHWFEQARIFGRALQTTNILKDVHEDARRGVCWLPRDLAIGGASEADITQRVRILAERAQNDLREALAFTLQLPAARADMRRFCLLPMGLAMVTLARLRERPAFADTGEIKVTREELGELIGAVHDMAADDTRLRDGFEQLVTLSTP
jgi:farnesyl-diphosphate farnesyltransferase